MAREGLAPVADRSLGYSVAARGARGRIVRLDASLNAILAAHDYPAPLARLLGEALVVTALLGATLRPEAKGDAGQLTLQAQAQGGPVDLLVCDYQAGALRGYLRHDADALYGDDMSLETLFGAGYLAITLEATTTAERYQGIVALEGGTLTEAATRYFEDSEQLPTLMRVAVSGDAETGWLAGGLLIQHLARGEIGGERLTLTEGHPDWQHVATLASTVTDAELIDPTLSPEDLLWRLFHEEEVRVMAGPALTRGCRCSETYIGEVLRRFSEDERAGMRDADGHIKVDCAFCAKVFAIDA